MSTISKLFWKFIRWRDSVPLWVHTPANDNWPVVDEIADNLGKVLRR